MTSSDSQAAFASALVASLATYPAWSATAFAGRDTSALAVRALGAPPAPVARYRRVGDRPRVGLAAMSLP